MCRAIHRFDTLPSTSRWLADELLMARDAPREVCLAEQQTEGRGRRGRAWFSPPNGSIYLSLAWQGDATDWFAQPVTLAFGMAITTALDALGIRGIGIKWPNDLYVRECKLAGILTEHLQRRGRSYWIIGLGLNLCSHNLPAMGQVPAIGMATLIPGIRQQRNRLVASLLDALLRTCLLLDQRQSGKLMASWPGYDLTYQRILRIKRSGGHIFEGEGEGIDAHGRLRIRRPQGILTLESGEVSLRLQPKSSCAYLQEPHLPNQVGPDDPPQQKCQPPNLL